MLAWESARFDETVADLFGYHALQLGLAQVDVLRNNRMPHRWRAVSTQADLQVLQHREPQCGAPVDLLADFADLPFESQSLDLVALPHTLEFAEDPHACLREVERVLMPEGHVVVCGFNNWSLWGARQALGRATGSAFLPRAGEFIGYRRIKDWMRLLGLEIVDGWFGCYCPPCRTERWLHRYRFMERAGARWWPVLGAVYMVVAVKRVRAMRLIGAAWKKPALQAKLKPAAQSTVHREAETEPEAG